MKTNILLVMAVLFLTAVSGFCISARTIGMGTAFIGVADDANAIFFNPAGIGFQKSGSMGITTMLDSSALYGSFTLNVMGLTIPSAKIGLGYIDSTYSGWVRESITYIGFGSSVSKSVAIGASIRTLNLDYEDYYYSQDIVETTTNIGMLINGNNIGLGICHGDMMFSYGAILEDVMAVGIKIGGEGALAVIDYGQTDSLGLDISVMSMGFEFMGKQGIGLRFGTSSIGFDGDMESYSAGVGVSIVTSNMQIHIAQAMPYFGGELMSEMALSFVSINFCFGGPKQEPEWQRYYNPNLQTEGQPFGSPGQAPISAHPFDTNPVPYAW